MRSLSTAETVLAVVSGAFLLGMTFILGQVTGHNEGRVIGRMEGRVEVQPERHESCTALATLHERQVWACYEIQEAP